MEMKPSNSNVTSKALRPSSRRSGSCFGAGGLIPLDALVVKEEQEGKEVWGKGGEGGGCKEATVSRISNVRMILRRSILSMSFLFRLSMCV